MTERIKKVIVRRPLEEDSTKNRDLAYWLSRPAEERVAAVDYLRKQHHGSSARLQRTARVVDRS